MSHCLGGDARTMRYLKGLDGLWYALTFDTASHIVIKNQREGDNYAIILQKKRETQSYDVTSYDDSRDCHRNIF